MKLHERVKTVVQLAEVKPVREHIPNPNCWPWTQTVGCVNRKSSGSGNEKKEFFRSNCLLHWSWLIFEWEWKHKRPVKKRALAQMQAVGQSLCLTFWLMLTGLGGFFGQSLIILIIFNRWYICTNRSHNPLQEGDEPPIHSLICCLVAFIIVVKTRGYCELFFHFSVSARKPCHELGALPSAEALDST
jgi:hypothetical protein